MNPLQRVWQALVDRRFDSHVERALELGNSHRDRVRPRYGRVIRSTGEQVPIQFVPDGPEQFRPVWASDGRSPVTLRPGEVLEADVLGPGQSIQVQREGRR